MRKLLLTVCLLAMAGCASSSLLKLKQSKCQDVNPAARICVEEFTVQEGCTVQGGGLTESGGVGLIFVCEKK